MWSRIFWICLIFVCISVSFAHVHDETHNHDHSHSHGHSHATNTNLNLTIPMDHNSAWANSLLATLVISVAPVLILPCVPVGDASGRKKDSLKVLVSFAVGGLLGDVFLHLLPHAFLPHSVEEEDVHDHTASMKVGLWTLLGIFLFFLLEKYMRGENNEGGSSHSHSHSSQEKEGEKSEKKKETPFQSPT